MIGKSTHLSKRAVQWQFFLLKSVVKCIQCCSVFLSSFHLPNHSYSIFLFLKYRFFQLFLCFFTNPPTFPQQTFAQHTVIWAFQASTQMYVHSLHNDVVSQNVELKFLLNSFVCNTPTMTSIEYVLNDRNAMHKNRNALKYE